MSKLLVHFENPNYSDEDLSESIVQILESSTELAMATVTSGNMSHISTNHFVYNNSLDLYILTPPYRDHSKNIDINPSVAAAIWERPDVPGENLRGIQAFGVCERVQKLDLTNAIRQYTQRFKSFNEVIRHPTDFAKGLTDSRFFVIKVFQIKLLDEPRFGRRNYITLNVYS